MTQRNDQIKEFEIKVETIIPAKETSVKSKYSIVFKFFKTRHDNKEVSDRLLNIYWLFGTLIRDEKFEELNNLIPLLDPKMELTLALGVLTTTSWAKDKLPNRTLFYNKIKWRWDVIFQPKLLDGLEP